MKTSIFSVVALLSSLAAAAPSIARRQAQTQTVLVGNNGSLAFSPAEITAQVGDMIMFVFAAKNHTVTQTSLQSPCSPAESTGQFNSNFQAVPAGAPEVPTQTLQITAPGAIYFTCLQTGHCGKGMVGVINAPASGAGSLAEFQAAAKSSGGAATNGTAAAAPAGAASGSGSKSGKGSKGASGASGATPPASSGQPAAAAPATGEPAAAAPATGEPAAAAPATGEPAAAAPATGGNQAAVVAAAPAAADPAVAQDALSSAVAALPTSTDAQIAQTDAGAAARGSSD